MSRDSAVQAALRQPGWRFAEDLSMVWDLAAEVEPTVHVVEVGSFLARTTLVLADARREVNGRPVTAIDPCDGRGDAFSEPYYAEILAQQEHLSQRDAIAGALEDHALAPWVDLVELTAEQAAASWSGEVGLLLLDGDQSRNGAASAFDSWQPFLVGGSIVVVGNSAEREYASGHDGNALLLDRCVRSGQFDLVHRGDTSVLRVKGP